MNTRIVGLTLLAALVIFSIGNRYFNHAWDCEQLYLEQAQSFLSGKLSIAVADQDTATYNGQFFAPYPPTPALIFLPAVALFGTHPVIPYFFSFLAVILIGLLAIKIAEYLKLDQEIVYWLTLGLTLGTGLWMCLQYSYSAAYNSHIFSFLFVIAGLHEALTKKRAWLIGLFLSAACTTRPFTIASGLFMLALLWAENKKTFSQKSHDILLMSLGALPLIIFATSFNYFRFGNIFDAGYTHIPGFNFSDGSLFNLKFIPRNLYTLLLRGPNMDILFNPHSVSTAVDFKFGIIGSDMGTAITYASPFLLLSVLAPWKSITTKLGWLALFIGIFPVLCYAAIGMFQLNSARYALDVLPILFVLTAFAVKNSKIYMPTLKFLIAYSIVLNIIFLTPILATTIKAYIKLLFALGA